MPIYDDFSAPEMSTELWLPRPSAPLTAAGAGITSTVDEEGCTLTLGRSGSPEAIFLSTRQWELYRDPVSFFTTLEADCAGDGLCAAFGVLDEESGSVIGIASTGTALIAIARGDNDPLAPLSVGALEFTDLAINTEPRRRHDVRIEYDPARCIARWYIDDVMQLFREVPLRPRQLACGFGLLPLHDLGGNAGKLAAAARWGAIQWQEESELEPDSAYSVQPG